MSEEILIPVSTFDEPLDNDLEAIDSSRSQEGGVWKRPSIYVAIFEQMINTVVDHELHLLSEGDKKLIFALRCLSYNARYCLFRLVLRKPDTWHTVASMKAYEKEVGSQGLLEAIDEICIPVQQIIANTPLSQSSQSSQPCASSQTSEPPTPGTRASSPESERAIIDLTMDSDDEDTVAPPPNAEAGPSFTDSVAQLDLKPSLESLKNPEWECNYEFLCENDANMNLEEALNKLTCDQLRELVKQMKVKPAKSNKAGMIHALRTHAMSQSVLDFGSKGKSKSGTGHTSCDGFRQTKLPFTHQKKDTNAACQRSQEERLMQMALQKLGRSVRVHADLYWLIVRLSVIYERSMEYPKSLLAPSLLASFKKRTYPEYNYTRDPEIWGTRQALLDYVEALRLEAELDNVDNRQGKPNLKTPIPGSNPNKFVTPNTPAPRATATPLRTPLNVNAGQVPESPMCKKEDVEEVKYKVEEDQEKEEKEEPRIQRARRIMDLFDSSIFPRWQEFVSAREKQEVMPRAPGLERFEPGYVYTRMFSRVLEALASLKLYTEELLVIEALLNQRLWRRGKRARWYERRAILLERYLSSYEDENGKKKYRKEIIWRAMEGVKEALKDEDTGIVFRPGLVRRLRRLEKRLQLPPEECCRCEAELQEVPIVYCGAVRIYLSSTSLKLDANGRPLENQIKVEESPSIRKHFQPVPSKIPLKQEVKLDKENIPQSDSPTSKPRWKGKSLWKGKNGEEINVETRALEFYQSKGFKGFHSESRVITTIFALLFWDIIFSDVPGAFETPYQTAPLDLAADTFYRSREDAIEARLEELLIPGRALEILSERDEQHRGRNTWCVGVRWDICEREDLLQIMQCRKGPPWAIICRLLCENYSGRSSGVPDLIVWSNETEVCKFVEVKGPGDRPQENQKLWFDTLMGAGADVEICRVYDINDPPRPKKPRKSGGKRTGQQAKPTKSEADQSMDMNDPESEEEANPDRAVDSEHEHWDSIPGFELPPDEDLTQTKKRRRSPSLSDMAPVLPAPTSLSSRAPSHPTNTKSVTSAKKRKRKCAPSG